MKAESSRETGSHLRRQGLWLACLALALGIGLRGAYPLWQQAFAEKKQARQLEARVDRLQQFAFHWKGETVEKEKRELAENARRLGEKRSQQAWLEKLENNASRCQVRCLQLIPRTEGKKGKSQKEFLEVTLEGNYIQLLTFFRQWEQNQPGCWTEGLVLEPDATGQKIRCNGKFQVEIEKSSKSR